ncbi:RRP12-like protein [Denticeps clupeoides]|uniref:RRP12-like protein n=1 Tax=Denticeps clupeoides TaxID=299321 RepID=A0AAY3ZUT1_9TELE|nr:RRP12-like protein [Denticeps clupeoides]
MVKSGKLRSGAAQKVKRWKKGRSSDSNPETSRHRQAARSRFFSRPSGKSDLTVDALKLHNELQSGTLEREAEVEAGPMEEHALSERTSGTFLSGLSDCSNLTFRKVQRYWESNSAAHKEICAVLAAVTEVIRSQGGKETETEYFAALMTTLEAVESSESLAAVAYLLNLVLKRVPAPVLKKKFSDTAKALMDVMSAHASADSTAALRWIVSCLATLLRKQDASVWSYPSTLQLYHGLLSFTVHTKPKVRKAAHQGVCSILKGSEFMFSENAPVHHPAAVTTAKFCCKEMEQTGEDTTTLHVLGLLKDLLASLPVGSVKTCCETLLRVMTLSHVLVTAGAMQAFHKLFSSKPSSLTLSAELNAQIVTALYDYLPSENDLQPLLAWLAVMEKAHTHLSTLQSSLCLAHLPRLFSTAMSCMLSPHTQVVSAAAQTLKTLLNECVAPHMADIGPVLPSASTGNAAHICKMFRAVEDGLSYRYHSSWAFVLQVLGCFYRAAGNQAHAIMAKSLSSLCDLRSTPRFPYAGELDQAVGGAVEGMGPQLVLKAVPLLITGQQDDMEFPRSWLVPVIRDHVGNTQLAFFSSYFLPLAVTLKHRSAELEQSGLKLEARVYETLQLQIWTMLPGFCTKPTDLVGSFQGIARTLGMAISERPDLRMPICQALRTLISKGCETEEAKAEVGRFAKNFLPILFNVYSQKPTPGDSGTRMAILDTIRVYLSITEPKMVCSFLEKASERLVSAESSEFTRLSVMDLVVAMASCVDESTMSHTFELIKPYLESKDTSLQKKAYRVLEEMCGGPGEASRGFVSNNLQNLQEVLLGSLKSAASPAKRPRLKCLIHVVRQLNEEHKDFISTLLPEVIVCTKEVSVGARKNAYSLLVEIGSAFIRFYGNTKDATDQYLALVYVGLTGSVTMITCTILALTRLVFQYKDSIEPSTLELLLQNVCLLLSSRTREVIKASLGFIKVILFIMDVKVLAGHVTSMMEAIGNIKDDMRRHFRMKLKSVFTKFIRKFGFELVKNMLPPEHHKVLANIRKVEARTKRRKQLQQAEEEGSESEDDAPKAKGDSIEEILAEMDSDESDQEEAKAKSGQKKAPRQKGKAWLKEGLSDDPLNFLDPKAAQRVLATNPDLKKSKKMDHGFKVTSDGRLIIQEEGEKKNSSKDAESEMKDILEEAGVKTKKTQKRKVQEADSDDDMEVEAPMKYKAGGGGIHRPLGGKAEFGTEYKSKKAKGDVKKKGKCDPYAYIPLNKTNLNRRKKAKLQGQFKGIVRGAKRGVLAAKRMQKNKRKA